MLRGLYWLLLWHWQPPEFSLGFLHLGTLFLGVVSLKFVFLIFHCLILWLGEFWFVVYSFLFLIAWDDCHCMSLIFRFLLLYIAWAKYFDFFGCIHDIYILIYFIYLLFLENCTKVMLLNLFKLHELIFWFFSHMHRLYPFYWPLIFYFIFAWDWWLLKQKDG